MHTSIAPALALIYDFLPGKAVELLVPLRGRAYRPRLSACQRSRYAYISSGIGLFWILNYVTQSTQLLLLLDRRRTGNPEEEEAVLIIQVEQR